MRPFRFHPKANCFEESPLQRLRAVPCAFTLLLLTLQLSRCCTPQTTRFWSLLHRRPFRERPLRLTHSHHLVKGQFLSVPKVVLRGSLARPGGGVDVSSCPCSDVESRECVTPICKVLRVSSRSRSRFTGSEASEARVLANPEKFAHPLTFDRACGVRVVGRSRGGKNEYATAQQSRQGVFGQIREY